VNSGHNRNDPPKLKDRLKRDGTYPRACAGDEQAMNDLRGLARHIQAKKVLYRKRAALLAAAGLALAIAPSFGAALSDKIAERYWRTNHSMIDHSFAMRGAKSIPITNVVTEMRVYRLGPGLPLFTNCVSLSTNVVWTKPPVKPIHSPKTKP